MSVKVEGSTFSTPYNRKAKRYFTDPGSREANTYEIQIDKKTGHKTLIKTGTKDIWQDIQSYKDECDIGEIIARAAAGDLDALNQRKGFYGDITETPRDLFEAQNNILKLERGFNELPAEIREKFDNSKEKFISEFGSVEWNEKMGFAEAKKAEETKAEETKDIDFVPGSTEAAKEILTPEGN